MSKKEGAEAVSFKKYALPAYIILSALIIIYVVYSMIVGGIYNVGAQQGYQAAVSQLIQQASQQDCKPVAINLGDTKVEVINVACLQQAPAQNTASEPVPTPSAE